MEPKITTSLIDRRTYAFRTLPTRLRVLYISDPEADKSAMAVTVRAGSARDPAGWAGLAHFCEHMLFMGTKDFEDVNGFDVFLSKNAGYTNAETSEDHTQFMFECDTPALLEGVQRLVSALVSPLFSLSCTEKEIKAIESELALLKNNDGARLNAVAKSGLNQRNPFAKDGQIVSPQLSTPAVAEKLRDFHGKFYSANVMTAAIYSPKPIAEIEAIVSPILQKVPNREINDIATFGTSPQIYGPEYRSRLFRVVPTELIRRLIFRWYMPSQFKDYKSNPGLYAQILLNHEGPNCLLTRLKDLGLVLWIDCGYAHEDPVYTCFYLELELTEKGEEHWMDVAEIASAYIVEMVQKRPLAEYVMLEDEKMRKLNFAYCWKQDYLDYAQRLSETMQLHPPEEIVDCGLMSSEFSPEKTRAFNSLLVPSHADIFLLTQTDKELCDRSMPIWGTKYTVGPFPRELAAKLSSPTALAGLGFPLPNPYIPTSLVPHMIEVVPRKEPELIRKSVQGEVWRTFDTSFYVPESIVMVYVYTGYPNYRGNAKGKVDAAFYDWTVSELTQELSYLGSDANVSCGVDFDRTSHGGLIAIDGYSTEKLVEFASAALRKLRQVTLKDCEAVFPRVKESLIKYCKNFEHQSSLEQAGEYMQTLLCNNHYLPHQLQPKVESMTAAELFESWQKWMNSPAYYRMYVHGTLSLEDSLRLSEAVGGFLGGPPIDLHTFPESTVVSIPPKSQFDFITSATDGKEVNSCYYAYFQLCEHSDEMTVALGLLIKCMEEKSFNILRTEEQLGYSVDVSTESQRDVLGAAFVIESHEYCPEYLLYRVDAFIETAIKYLTGLSQEEFDKFKQSEKVEYERKDIDLEEAASRLGDEIFQCEFDYGWRQKYIRILSGITKQQIVELAERLFVKQYKRINVEVVCKKHLRKNRQLYKQNKARHAKQGRKRTRLGDVTEFRMLMRHYPDMNRERLLRYVSSAT